MAKAGITTGRTSKRSIIVVGGGIAGLTAALALAKAGFNIHVLEQQTSASNKGAGIQLSPNAYHVLNQLGLSRSIRSASTAPECIEIKSGVTGKKISNFDLGARFREKYDAPYLVLHRGDLLQVLMTACEQSANIHIDLGHRVYDLAFHANGVTALVMRNERLEEIQAIACIGADGVWSSVRKYVPDSAQPIASNSVAWRCLVPIEQISPQVSRSTTGLWLGPNAHLVHYPIRSGSVMNIVAITACAPADQTKQGWLTKHADDMRLAAFDGWHARTQHLISSGENWGGWPLYSVKKLGAMANGPLCLIGDAAHPMLPFAAQGGACSIEDAAVLADHCKQNPNDLPQAFEAFSKHRKGRINKILKLSANNRHIYHLTGKTAFVRDIALKFSSQRAVQKRTHWLYSWKPPLL